MSMRTHSIKNKIQDIQILNSVNNIFDDDN